MRPAPAVHHAFLRARGPRVTVRRKPFEGAEPITTELVRAEPAGRFTLLEVKAPFARRHQVRTWLRSATRWLVTRATADRRYPASAGTSCTPA